MPVGLTLSQDIQCARHVETWDRAKCGGSEDFRSRPSANLGKCCDVGLQDSSVAGGLREMHSILFHPSFLAKSNISSLYYSFSPNKQAVVQYINSHLLSSTSLSSKFCCKYTIGLAYSPIGHMLRSLLAQEIKCLREKTSSEGCYQCVKLMTFGPLHPFPPALRTRVSQYSSLGLITLSHRTPFTLATLRCCSQSLPSSCKGMSFKKPRIYKF